MSAPGGFEARLAELADRGLLRTRQQRDATATLSLCSNDYLGYAHQPLAPRELDAIGGASGASGSRLISGDHASHDALERALAAWVGLPCALSFSSGYAANVGTIPAIAERDDLIISDELNHASIIDGCRLSRASVVVTPHLDVDAVERALANATRAQHRWVITESYFSMDGDVADLQSLREVCDRYGAGLVVDEAHALGVFGPRGAGLCMRDGIVPDVLIGTLGKAVGLQGAFVAGSNALQRLLWNRARSFVFSTGTLPWLAALTHTRLTRVIADDAGRQRLAWIAGEARRRLAAAPLIPSVGPILPWRVGTPQQAVNQSRALLDAGIHVQAIRPPTVPTGGSRLRVTLRADLTDPQLDLAISKLLSLV